MRSESSESLRDESHRPLRLDRPDLEGAVIGLLTRELGPWSRAELEREVGGMHGNPTQVVDAIGCLYAYGLVHVQGELVSPTCAARRMDELYSYRFGDREGR
jgi:hypothetical protein